MKRKEFIAKSAGSLAALTVINLLKLEAKNAIKSDKELWTFYRKFQEAKGTEIIIRKFYFEINKSLEDNALNTIYLKVETYTKGDKEKESLQTAKYQIEVKRIKPVETDSGYEYYINCGKYKKIEGPELLFDCEFEPLQSKKSDVQITVDSGIATMQVSQKGNWLMTLDEFDPNADDKDDDCYLTTVCVNLIGKPDDCYELQTLRSFRDNYITSQSQGKQLIASYYNHAPAIVSAIYTNSQKYKIASTMYTDLVMPTVSLIQQKRLAEAADYYTQYALALHHQLNQSP